MHAESQLAPTHMDRAPGVVILRVCEYSTLEYTSMRSGVASTPYCCATFGSDRWLAHRPPFPQHAAPNRKRVVLPPPTSIATDFVPATGHLARCEWQRYDGSRDARRVPCPRDVSPSYVLFPTQ